MRRIWATPTLMTCEPCPSILQIPRMLTRAAVIDTMCRRPAVAEGGARRRGAASVQRAASGAKTNGTGLCLISSPRVAVLMCARDLWLRRCAV
jgi:hypothetical protein